VETSLFFLATFVVASALPLALGLPVVARWDMGQGIRGLGFGVAVGMAMILIVCRAVQMAYPIGVAAMWMVAATLLALVALWYPTRTRSAVRRLWHLNHHAVVAFICVGSVVALLLNVPILIGNALQFEGSRNADSFTFTSNARYMIEHAFFGAADFSPENPVYSISRSYFGESANQPRPAAEGYLAWLSALSARDPLYLYNAMQGAGFFLAGLSVLTLLPPSASEGGKSRMWATATMVFGCPALAYVAINSNFANNLNLAPATAYVALALVSNWRIRTALGALFVASLLGGYPELLVFLVACRVLAMLFRARSEKKFCARTPVLMGAELALGCMAVPWATKAAFIVYATTLGIGSSQDATLHGDVAEGLPLFGLALCTFLFCFFRRRGKGEDRHDFDSLYAAALIVFALAQVAMLIKGFAYGGFRLAGYFVTLHLGVLAGSALNTLTQQTSGFMTAVVRNALFAAALAMPLKTSLMMEKSWRIAKQRHVSPDLITLTQWLDRRSGDGDVLMGPMHQPFYHGMWIRYLTSAPLIYDFSRGEAAGYLSPYLKTVQRDNASIAWIITSDDKVKCSSECDEMESFGRWFVLRARFLKEEPKDSG